MYPGNVLLPWSTITNFVIPCHYTSLEYHYILIRSKENSIMIYSAHETTYVKY